MPDDLAQGYARADSPDAQDAAGSNCTEDGQDRDCHCGSFARAVPLSESLSCWSDGHPLWRCRGHFHDGDVCARTPQPSLRLAFAVGCVLSSGYGFASGAWPFGVVELVWALVAVRRWREHAQHRVAPRLTFNSG
jgi:hypothetical protein